MNTIYISKYKGETQKQIIMIKFIHINFPLTYHVLIIIKILRIYNKI